MFECVDYGVAYSKFIPKTWSAIFLSICMPYSFVKPYFTLTLHIFAMKKVFSGNWESRTELSKLSKLFKNIFLYYVLHKLLRKEKVNLIISSQFVGIQNITVLLYPKKEHEKRIMGIEIPDDIRFAFPYTCKSFR